MPRPRRARITKARELDESRGEAVKQILDALNEDLPSVAKTLSAAAIDGDVAAATTIIKFVADNTRITDTSRGETILRAVAEIRRSASKGELEEEFSVPKDVNVEAELDGAKVEAGTKPAD